MSNRDGTANQIEPPRNKNVLVHLGVACHGNTFHRYDLRHPGMSHAKSRKAIFSAYFQVPLQAHEYELLQHSSVLKYLHSPTNKFHYPNRFQNTLRELRYCFWESYNSHRLQNATPIHPSNQDLRAFLDKHHKAPSIVAYEQIVQNSSCHRTENSVHHSAQSLVQTTKHYGLSLFSAQPMS